MSENNNSSLPEKILIIKDCTFILPPNFDGTVEDAFDEFLKYREKKLNDAVYCDEAGLMSTFNILLHSRHDAARVCGEYAIYELKNGKYRLAGATNPKSAKFRVIRTNQDQLSKNDEEAQLPQIEDIHE